MNDETITMPRWEFDAVLDEQYNKGYTAGYEDGQEDAERDFYENPEEEYRFQDIEAEDYYVEGDLEPPMEDPEHE